MKHLLSFFLLVLFTVGLNAQIPGLEEGESPVQWKGTVEKKSDNTYDLVFKAKIKENWHIFSQHTPDGGSLPLYIEYLGNGDAYQTNGETQESPTVTQFNDVFGVDEIIWEDTATLTQNVSSKSDDFKFVKAELSYQVCDEMCINEDYYFVFDIEKGTAEIFDNYDEFEAYGNEPEVFSDSQGAEDPNFGGAMGGTVQPNAESPVEWTGKVIEKSKGSYDLVFEADIIDGWHIFSQHTPEGGSLPLEIDYLDNNNGYKTVGETEESPTVTQFNDVFGVDEMIWEKTATLTQNIEVKDKKTRYIKAELFYQVCDEVCINEEYYFVFDLKEKKAQIFSNYDEFEAFATTSKGGLKDKWAGADVTDEADETDRSLWTTFFLAFLWGFAALLTPCVFPMIPMTVSFFTKQSTTKAAGKRNAILYGLFIIIIYVVLGTLVVGIFGADSLNKLSTNVTFNIIFFLMLVIFAASFLGAFEIVLPSSWANKVDKQADRGGIIGIFFMALALAIVSFSCTGPIIGTLLVQASSKGGIAPIIGMLGFSFALAVPFGLFALFPGWMNSLPKSGGWLNSVKVVLGLLELALAFKFLSNADLVVQAGLLQREVFLAIWIAIFGIMAFYLFGKIQLPNDSKPEFISVGRLSLGMVALAFTIYLIPGIWGAPLKLLSGYLPPEHYSESPYGVGYTNVGNFGGQGSQNEIPDGMVPGPQNILAFRDYDKGLEYAKKVGKPILLDFTGMACVNCRKMEDRVWSETQIKSIIQNDVVLISLYVDIDEKLPVEEQYTSETTGKRIRTVGNKWSDFQIKNYQMHAQPYYVLVAPEDEANLNKPVGYTPDSKKYEEWLKDGIGNYKTNSGGMTEFSASMEN